MYTISFPKSADAAREPFFCNGRRCRRFSATRHHSRVVREEFPEPVVRRQPTDFRQIRRTYDRDENTGENVRQLVDLLGRTTAYSERPRKRNVRLIINYNFDLRVESPVFRYRRSRANAPNRQRECTKRCTNLHLNEELSRHYREV